MGAQLVPASVLLVVLLLLPLAWRALLPLSRIGARWPYLLAVGVLGVGAFNSLQYLALMKEELGHRWLQPDLFRFGASSLLGDIERQLEHHLTGRYSAANRHPMG